MILYYLIHYRLDSVGFAGLVVGSALLARRCFLQRDLIGRHLWQKWMAVGVIIVGACLMAEVFGYRALQTLKESAAYFAADYACDMTCLDHTLITPNTRADDAHYRELIAAEKEWLRINPKAADVFTCRRGADGRFVTLVSIERAPGRGDDAPIRRIPIGQLLSEADGGLARAAGGEALIDCVPTADARGAWIRALHPIWTANGQVDAVLGLHFPAGPWVQAIALERWLAFLRFYVVFVLAVCIDYISRQQTKLAGQREIEAQLRESENRFRALCENIPNIAVQGYDRERRVIFWNQASTGLYGYTREEALGRPLEELIIPPLMREPVIAGINHWITAGVAIPPGELVLQRKDGSPVNVYSSHVMQRNHRGEPEMYCVDIDLAERNSALAALAASESNYRTLFEVIPHALIVYDAETLALLAVNKTATTTYGYTRDEFLRLKLRDLASAEHEPDMGIKYYRTLNAGYAGPTEWHHRRRNGEVFLVEVIGQGFTWAGRRARIILAQDITARRAAERRVIEQAELLDKISEAIVVTDAAGGVTFWNQGAEQMFGRSADGMHGRKLQDAPAPAGSALASLAKHFGAGRHDRRAEIQASDAGGRPLFIETSITVLRDGAGEAVGQLSVSTNVTQRKALEAQVIQAQKMEVIGQLAGGVAHDFNSILMAMTLNLEMLEMDMQSHPSGLAMVGDVKTMTQRAAKLVGQLLLFARKHTMKLQTLELNAALAGVAKMLQRLIGADITLEIKDDGTALWIDADASMMDQVILNLSVNARDAMPAGGTLLITTSRVEFDDETARVLAHARPGAFACLRVSDTGCGMSPEVMAHIFEPFYTTKEAGKGTGLGLSTVHGIVSQHRGWITVDSALGCGTEFRVYLPLSENAETGVQDPVGDCRGGNETVLLVEDDDSVRSSCAAMLLRLGYRVWACSEAQKAMSVWEQNSGSIDLLLADMVLPGGIRGLKLAELLREKQPSLGVVLMSGDNTEIIKADELLGPGYRFIQKPFQSASLARVIRSCLD